MKNCIECNHRFTFYDRLKTIFNLRGHLKCPQCNSVYKPKANAYRGIYYFLVTFIAMTVFDKVTLNNYILYIIYACRSSNVAFV